jgi:hypothetical protein
MVLPVRSSLQNLLAFALACLLTLTTVMTSPFLGRRRLFWELFGIVLALGNGNVNVSASGKNKR